MILINSHADKNPSLLFFQFDFLVVRKLGSSIAHWQVRVTKYSTVDD
jgi:hypothetical protein